MKKFVSIMAVALVAVFAISVLAACGGYPADPKKAQEKLEKDGYTVMLEEFEGDEVDEEGVVAMIVAYKLTDNMSKIDAVIIVYFESSAKAKEQYESEEFKAQKEAYEEMGAKVSRSGKQVIVEISGKTEDLAGVIGGGF